MSRKFSLGQADFGFIFFLEWKNIFQDTHFYLENYVSSTSIRNRKM